MCQISETFTTSIREVLTRLVFWASDLSDISNMHHIHSRSPHETGVLSIQCVRSLKHPQLPFTKPSRNLCSEHLTNQIFEKRTTSVQINPQSICVMKFRHVRSLKHPPLPFTNCCPGQSFVTPKKPGPLIVGRRPNLIKVVGGRGVQINS